MFCLLLVGCSAGEVEEKPVEGIKAKLDITSNSEPIDEGFFQATITNETDKTFVGSITFHHSSFKFWTEEINIPPGKDDIKNLKTKYIKHPQDEYTYKVEGEFVDKSFVSNVDYEIFKTDTDGAFNIQVSEITKENVVDVVNEMYSIHGDRLKNLSFFDDSQTLKDGVDPEEWPEASYFGNGANKSISINNESFDFVPE